MTDQAKKFYNTDEFREELRSCIKEAIEEVGLEDFKKCSMFMSNRENQRELESAVTPKQIKMKRSNATSHRISRNGAVAFPYEDYTILVSPGSMWVFVRDDNGRVVFTSNNTTNTIDRIMLCKDFVDTLCGRKGSGEW